MDRIDCLIENLRALRKKLRSEESRKVIDQALYELENIFNPADGVWIVKNRGREARKFADLAELDLANFPALAALETRRNAACRAMTRRIEATRREMPQGETWWTFDGQSVIDAVFRAVLNGEEPEW